MPRLRRSDKRKHGVTIELLCVIADIGAYGHREAWAEFWGGEAEGRAALGPNSKSGRPDSNRRRPAWEAGILPLNYARVERNVSGHPAPCQLLRLLVPPRHDPRPRGLEAELLIRTGLERRHVHALRHDHTALRVQQLEAQLAGVVRLLANVRDQPCDARALLVRGECAYRDLDRDQLALLQVVEGRCALVSQL